MDIDASTIVKILLNKIQATDSGVKIWKTVIEKKDELSTIIELINNSKELDPDSDFYPVKPEAALYSIILCDETEMLYDFSLEGDLLQLEEINDKELLKAFLIQPEGDLFLKKYFNQLIKSMDIVPTTKSIKEMITID